MAVRANILGGDGVVGYGIRTTLTARNQVAIFGRESYDEGADRYSSNALPRCDCLVHAAGVTDEEVARDDRKAILRSTTAATELFETAAHAGCTHLVYVSSMHVYGPLINMGTAIDERVCPVPGNIYGFCHLATEWALRHVAMKHRLNGLIVRPGAVYGFPAPGRPINRLQLIPYDFPGQLIDMQTIVLKTVGNQYRSFCSNAYVGQLVLNWLSAATDKRDVAVVNASGDATMTVREFADACAAIYESVTGQPGKVEVPGSAPSGPLKPVATADIPISLREFLSAYITFRIAELNRPGH